MTGTQNTAFTPWDLIIEDPSLQPDIQPTFPQIFSLPLEIRRMIYKYAMEGEFNVKTTRHDPRTSIFPSSFPDLQNGWPTFTRFLGPIPKLMRASQQLYLEAGVVFIENSTMIIGYDGNRRQIRHAKHFLKLFPARSGFRAVRRLKFLSVGRDHDPDTYALENRLLKHFRGLKMVEMEIEYWNLRYPRNLKRQRRIWEALFKCKALRQLILVPMTLKDPEDLPDEWMVDELDPYAEKLRQKFRKVNPKVDVIVTAGE